MKIQGYPLVCSGIHYTGYHLKAMCKECPLYSRKKQPFHKSWRISGIEKCIINMEHVLNGGLVLDIDDEDLEERRKYEEY